MIDDEIDQIVYGDDEDRPDRPPSLCEGDPYAEIEQTGRWGYYITIHHGVMQWGPDGGGFLAFGKREWAEWKASRLLLRYSRQHDLEMRPKVRIDGWSGRVQIDPTVYEP